MTLAADRLRAEIAERQRAEQDARRATLVMQAVLGSLAEGVVAVDHAGKALFWNAAATRIAGTGTTALPLDEWPAHFGVFREDGKTPFPAREMPLARAIAGETVNAAIQRLMRPDLPAGGRWLSVNARPLVDEDGAHLGGVVSFTDVTEERARDAEVRRLSAALHERVEQLHEANAELRAFAYTVSHDLRAPLRAVHGFADALLEDHGEPLSAEGRAYARRVADAAVRMDTLIHDLLEYSQLTEAQFERSSVDLRKVLTAAKEQVAAELRAADVTVEMDPTWPPTALGHHRTLVQIVANLLSNAAKFVPDGVRPAVRVRSERRGRVVRLWVEDNGIGIAPEHQDRIFRVFERLHGRERYAGTGLGLAIVSKGMQRLGGTSGVESALGNGSRFWIELPLASRQD